MKHLIAALVLILVMLPAHACTMRAFIWAWQELSAGRQTPHSIRLLSAAERDCWERGVMQAVRDWESRNG